MNRRFSALVALPLLCVAACSGSFFQSKATSPTIYVLAPAARPADPAAPAVIPADLMVLKPKLATGLESDRIAALYPDHRLDYFADARWSGALADVLQDFALQELHAHARFRTVSGDASVFTSGYWLEIEVTDFQAEYGSASQPPTVHVRLLARIGNSGDRHLLGRFESDARQPAAENRLSAIVDAYARAADTAFGEIAGRAAESLAGVSETR